MYNNWSYIYNIKAQGTILIAVYKRSQWTQNGYQNRLPSLFCFHDNIPNFYTTPDETILNDDTAPIIDAVNFYLCSVLCDGVNRWRPAENRVWRCRRRGLQTVQFVGSLFTVVPMFAPNVVSFYVCDYIVCQFHFVLRCGKALKTCFKVSLLSSDGDNRSKHVWTCSGSALTAIKCYECHWGASKSAIIWQSINLDAASRRMCATILFCIRTLYYIVANHWLLAPPCPSNWVRVAGQNTSQFQEFLHCWGRILFWWTSLDVFGIYSL